jgi:hypothetical protein
MTKTATPTTTELSPAAEQFCQLWAAIIRRILLARPPHA